MTSSSSSCAGDFDLMTSLTLSRKKTSSLRESTSGDARDVTDAAPFFVTNSFCFFRLPQGVHVTSHKLVASLKYVTKLTSSRLELRRTSDGAEK